MTTVTDTLIDTAGNPLANIPVDIVLNVPGSVNAYNGTSQVMSHVAAKTNANGQWTVSLIPNSLITPIGTTYTVTTTIVGEEPNLVQNFIVPNDSLTHHLSDLLI